ncbi:hypothetical protein DWV06_16085 [Anaerosacchariphilus polymeriproducens]|uniref:Transglutaminase-like domain-containing protein n=2 Tax=Anaerosacchariphilus polymeriproducens TaxID=1812858 RepID=A0A371AR44_9FIRM|nr:hypothetical protein DWV06_16085 [Anaerosacchariphilus polymeriproducens]
MKVRFIMRRKRNKIRYYVSVVIIILCVFTIVENKKLINSKLEDVWTILQDTIVENESKKVIEKSKDTTKKSEIEETKSNKSKKTIGEIERYAYSYLNKEEKKVYMEWVDILLEHKTKVEVSTLDPDIIEKAYRYVLSDYPGMFWVNGYSYVEHKLFNKTTKVVVEPEFTMTKEERQVKQKQIDAKVNEYLSGISQESSDYEKMKYVYDSLTTKVVYNKNAKDNQNICSVFLNGESVCQGYAYATQYLLQKLNIPCVSVTGTALGEGHAWNLVKLDGQYYYVDTTWGSNSNQKEYANQVNYAYFCLTSAEMSLTHQPSGLFPLPECTATQNNYFVKEGYYFESFETSVLSKFIQTAYESQQNAICLKFANKELYESFRKYYIEESHIFDCIGQTTSIRYLEDNVHNVLTFYRQSE